MPPEDGAVFDHSKIEMVLQECAANEQTGSSQQVINYDAFDDDGLEPPMAEECFTPASSDPILNNSMNPPRHKTTSIQEKTTTRKKPSA